MAVERCVRGMAYQVVLVLQRIYERGGCRGSQEAVPNLVRFGARDARADWRTARADGLSCQNGRGSLGGDPRPMDLRSDHRLHGGVQHTVPNREA